MKNQNNDTQIEFMKDVPVRNQNNAPQFEIIQMAPRNTNSVLLTRGNDAVIFDAWGRADAWDALLSERNLTLRAIYATHGHPDHIAAAPELAARHNVPWYLCAMDNDLIGWGNGLLEYFEMPIIAPGCTRPDDIMPGMYAVLPGIKMHVIAAPGHSAGGVMYYFPDYTILLTGDTLFYDNVGRTDLPGGDMCTLRQSIAELVNMNLPDETFIVHGHGIDSTIDIQKRENPYFTAKHKCCGGGAHGVTCKCGH